MRAVVASLTLTSFVTWYVELEGYRGVAVQLLGMLQNLVFEVVGVLLFYRLEFLHKLF